MLPRPCDGDQGLVISQHPAQAAACGAGPGPWPTTTGLC
jgi:hypothetical protein